MSLFYVRNPIALGEYRHTVRVVGYDSTKGRTAPYVVPRGHVIEVLAGSPAFTKWVKTKCLEPYNKRKHKDAILELPPEQRPTLPSWTRQEEPGREIEREMDEQFQRKGRW
jgi:hypothetical protein